MRIQRCLLATIMITLVLILAVAITTGQPLIHQFDTWGLNAAGAVTPARTAWARFITNFGEPVNMTITAIVVSLWALWRRRPAWAATVAGGVLSTAIINRLFKALIERPRPFVADPTLHALTPASGWSFPSGHASASAALVTVIIIYIWHWHRRPLPRTLVIILGIIYAATIMWSRVYLHVHFASDVLAGALEGIACAIIAREIVHWITFRGSQDAIADAPDDPAN